MVLAYPLPVICIFLIRPLGPADMAFPVIVFENSPSIAVSEKTSPDT